MFSFLKIGSFLAAFFALAAASKNKQSFQMLAGKLGLPPRC
jgi:hypothetical protein